MITLKDLQTLPELLAVKDLILLGVFTSDTDAYIKRASNSGPSYTKIGRQYVYKRDDVAVYLKMRMPVKEVLLSIEDRVAALEVEYAKLINHIN